MDYIVMAYIVTDYIVIAHIVMAHIEMAYIVMAYRVMAYIGMAYIGMAYIVMECCTPAQHHGAFRCRHPHRRCSCRARLDDAHKESHLRERDGRFGVWPCP